MIHLNSNIDIQCIFTVAKTLNCKINEIADGVLVIPMPNDVVSIVITAEVTRVPKLKGYSCKHMVVIGGENLTSIEAMFDSCNVETLDLSRFNLAKANSVNAMFKDCKISSVEVPEGKIGDLLITELKKSKYETHIVKQ